MGDQYDRMLPADHPVVLVEELFGFVRDSDDVGDLNHLGGSVAGRGFLAPHPQEIPDRRVRMRRYRRPNSRLLRQRDLQSVYRAGEVYHRWRRIVQPRSPQT